MFLSVAPSLTGSTGVPAGPSTSVLQDIPTASLVINKKAFSPKSMERVKALMSKENRTETLIKVGTKEAATHYDVPTSQDEESYDGDVSGEDEDAEVVPDDEDCTQIETLKLTENKTLQDNEGQEETNKEDGDQGAKSGNKKPVQKCSKWASSGSRDGQLVTTRKFSPKVNGLNTPRITSLSTVYRGQAGYFS